MIIITSDEHLIEQFSHHRPKNTRIIDLEDDQVDQSIDTNNTNLVNMALLAELSNLNSNNDQIFKRALDYPQQNPNKPSKISRKSTGMFCTICGDHAIGFNYDVLSCASCKSFFRRNANQDMEKMRCLTGRGQCSVAHETRRKCQKCRLERCFAVGMRKDFLQTEEEKQRRQQRLEENRNMTSKRASISDSSVPSSSISNPQSSPTTFDEIDQLLLDMKGDESEIIINENLHLDELSDPLFDTISVEDWITIESIRSAFLLKFQKDLSQAPTIDLADRTSALISWSHIASQTALHFIEFFRQIHEFENLDNDDRFILIKYNIFPLYPIIKCFYFDRTKHCCSDGNNEGMAKYQQFYQLCFGADGMGEKFHNLIYSLIELTEQDPAILSLLLTILMFYERLSINEDQPLLKDHIAVNRAQSYYTEILWKYMISKWNEEETWKRFNRLIPIIFQIQLTSNSFREYFRTQIATSDTIHKLAPLIQTLLHVS